ncbi:MAG: BON domain-containing protein [Lysobacter sp.]|nr:BON domain-containing protein [Lysobacter sp.]
MNDRSRDERDIGDRTRSQYSPYASSHGDWQERDRYRRHGGRSDRDIQSDYSGGGYDRMASRDQQGGGTDWRGGRESEYSSDVGSGGRYGGAGYGYGAAGAGGVGYGAPGYGAGAPYSAGSRYRGEFQSDRDWLDEGEGYSGYNYNRGMDNRYGGGSPDGASAREGQHGREGYGQHRSSGRQDWRTRGSAGQGYGERGYESHEHDDRTQGYGTQAGLQGSQPGQLGRSYRGVGPRNYTRSDERIREDLNERLTDAHDIDASGISVEVSNGVATLSGSVDERWMKHRAEDIADGCSGVRDVHNMIQVVPHAPSQHAGKAHHAQGSSTGSTTSQGSHGSTGASGGSLGASSGSTQYGGTTGSGTSGSSTPGSSAGASSPHTGSTGSTGSSRGPNV